MIIKRWSETGAVHELFLTHFHHGLLHTCEKRTTFLLAYTHTTHEPPICEGGRRRARKRIHPEVKAITRGKRAYLEVGSIQP